MKVLGKWKKQILILSDAVLINLAYILAFYCRYSYTNFMFYSKSYKEIALIVTVIYIACFYLFKLYESLWSYASIVGFRMSFRIYGKFESIINF
jgi:FlaA1/EpsC-like NDP-sugar epimerase